VGDRARLLARIDDALDRRQLTNNGPLVREFEQRIADYTGTAHCVAVCNATLGLQLAVRALSLSGEVIVPAFTFPATVHALAWEGVTPVFCDVDPRTHNIDPAAVERLIGPHTTGILGVHLWGNGCDVNALSDIAQRHGLRLLFDAAHAFGCGHNDQMVGNFGDAEVFSFHATKFLNSAEGGAIVTNNDELAASLRRLRCFGLEEEHVVEIGANAKMNELSAAMGLTSLESCDAFIAKNRENYLVYCEALAGIPGLRLLEPANDRRHNWQYVVVDVDARQAGRSRDDIQAALHAENVLAKRYFWPGCHRLPPYAAHAARGASLPHTDALCQRLLQLPTGSAVSGDDVAMIGDFLHRLTAPVRRAA
jgi:dTDP-4-amino-4,6-dideoxygalactose transaminase